MNKKSVVFIINVTLLINVVSFVLAFAKMYFFCSMPLWLMSSAIVGASMYANSIYKRDTYASRQKLTSWIAGVLLLYAIGICGFQIIIRDGYCIDALLIFVLSFLLIADLVVNQIIKYEQRFGKINWQRQLIRR